MITINDQEQIAHRPGLTVQLLLDETGRTEGLFTVVVDGQMVPRAAYATHVVEDGAAVNIFQISHGG